MKPGTAIDYPGLVLRALRGAVASLLAEVAEDGLPGEHFFYITFRTDVAGVGMPEALRRQYPEEITIVLQNQFWNLEVDPDGFNVDLRFGGAPATLRVPFEAMTAFADPSADFGLQLGEAPAGEQEDEPPTAPAEPAVAEGDGERSSAGNGADADGNADAVDAAGGKDVAGDGATVIDFDAERRRR